MVETIHNQLDIHCAETYRCVNELNVARLLAIVPRMSCNIRKLRYFLVEKNATAVQHNTRCLQMCKFAIVVAFQVHRFVITGSGCCKIGQNAFWIADAAQSIEQIVDSLRFTSCKCRRRLSNNN
jgi:hypothetical protein